MNATAPVVGDSEPGPRAPRNLVVCCDGTGNMWKPGPRKTNVVKIVEALIRDTKRQLHYYDPGVGTPDGYVSEDSRSPGDVVKRLGGLVWGDGVWANVAGAYSFLVQTYQPGDRIYLFGFSRGAFTARAVAGMINLFGILRPEHDNLIPTLLETFRTIPKAATHPKAAASRTTASTIDGDASDKPQGRDDIADSLRSNFAYTDTDTNVHFIGVWDTVETVGLSELAMGATITSDPTVKPSYVHVRHAVALDERREPYTPRLYLQPPPLSSGRTYKQVWFAGCHSDVGGGYDEDGLANTSFQWMAREASHCGLLLEFNLVDVHPVNPFDTLHDEITDNPAWVLAAVGARDVPPDAVFHTSVAERINNPVCAYRSPLPAGTVLEPTAADVVDANGTLRPRPLPRTTSQRSRLHPTPGIAQYVWLAVSLLATVLLLSWHHQDEWALALAQLGALSSGDFCGELALRGFPAKRPFDHLLLSDTLAVVAYGSLLPVLGLFLFRLSDRDGAIPAWLGRWYQWGAFALPLFDALENFLSDRIIRHAGHDGSLTCGAWVSVVSSRVLGAVSGMKWVALAVLVVLVCVCVARALRASRRRRIAL